MQPSPRSGTRMGLRRPLSPCKSGAMLRHRGSIAHNIFQPGREAGTFMDEGGSSPFLDAVQDAHIHLRHVRR